jgi:4-aminobutyrate aminotransferase/(S)-3-amino-2-methylpropionate transaminase
MAHNGFSLTPVDVPKVSTKYRKIVTAIPVPESIPMFAELEQLESNSMHGQLPVVWDRAKDVNVFDPWGNQWLDFTSTIFVANSGHGNPKIVDAIVSTATKPLLHTYTYLSQERLDYLRYLIQETPDYLEKAFLLSAGTEATECALKLMRLNGQRVGKRKLGILTFQGNWHGRTMGAQQLSGIESQKEWIGYKDPNIFTLPFPYPWDNNAQQNSAAFFTESLEKLFADHQLAPEDICGIMMETFQGWGAVFYPAEFVQAVRQFASDNNILLAFDEMQSGFGRTGKMFGFQHYEVEPDLICCGKGASSSLPLSIVMGSRQTMDLAAIGSMSSTHSANPMVCAAGLANLQTIVEGGLVSNSEVLGRLFHEKLDELKNRFSDYISDVLGIGLLAALHFNDTSRTPLNTLCDRICEFAMQRGLLIVHTGRESIKLAPPLTISEEALLEGIEVLASCIQDAIDEN